MFGDGSGVSAACVGAFAREQVPSVVISTQYKGGYWRQTVSLTAGEKLGSFAGRSKPVPVPIRSSGRRSRSRRRVTLGAGKPASARSSPPIQRRGKARTLSVEVGIRWELAEDRQSHGAGDLAEFVLRLLVRQSPFWFDSASALANPRLGRAPSGETVVASDTAGLTVAVVTSIY